MDKISHIFENNYRRHINIDTLEDWAKAEQMIQETEN